METSLKNKILLLEEIKFRRLYINLITHIYVQPVKLRYLLDSSPGYYWWLSIDTKIILKSANFELSPEDLINCSCINKLQNQVKSRRKVFPEILEYLEKLDDAIIDTNSDSYIDE